MEFFGPNKLGQVLLQLLLSVSISTCLFPGASGQFHDSLLLHLPPAPAPSSAHHHRVPPPLPPPAHPPHPKHPPVKPPVHPPVKPPVHPPVHPPVKPPVKPPVHPPVKPPVHPPVHPPVEPPVHPPVHPPVKPPVHPPVKPPVHPPVSPPPVRSFIVVEGVVFCKSCKYKGKDTLVDAKPIYGAVVKLVCKNTKYRTVQTAKTDKNGYFLIKAPKTVTSYAYRKCKVSLVSSPLASCKKPSVLNGGRKGAVLWPKKSFVVNKLPFVLYSVGPFAFEPTCPR